MTLGCPYMKAKDDVPGGILRSVENSVSNHLHDFNCRKQGENGYLNEKSQHTLKPSI